MTGRSSSEPSSKALANFAYLVNREKNQNLLKEALEEGIDIKRFMACTWIQIQQSEDVRRCAEQNPRSVFLAMLQVARMGLYPDGISGEAYLTVFTPRDKATGQPKTPVCVGIRGYRGMMKLFTEDNPNVDPCQPLVFDTVHEHDKFSYARGMNPRLEHEPPLKGERGEITHYYAAVRWKTLPGEPPRVWPKVMTVAEVEEFKKYASSAAFWDSKHENTKRWQRLKTVIKQLLKEVPMPAKRRATFDAETAQEESGGEFSIAEMVDIDLDAPFVAGDKVEPTQARALDPGVVETIPRPDQKTPEPRKSSGKPVQGAFAGATPIQTGGKAQKPALEPRSDDPQNPQEIESHEFSGSGRFCGLCGLPPSAEEHEAFETDDVPEPPPLFEDDLLKGKKR